MFYFVNRENSDWVFLINFLLLLTDYPLHNNIDK